MLSVPSPAKPAEMGPILTSRRPLIRPSSRRAVKGCAGHATCDGDGIEHQRPDGAQRVRQYEALRDDGGAVPLLDGADLDADWRACGASFPGDTAVLSRRRAAQVCARMCGRPGDQSSGTRRGPEPAARVGADLATSPSLSAITLSMALTMPT